MPLTEFDAVAERLNVVIDRLGELISAQWAIAAQKKPHPVKPYPRPVTAAQRAAQRRKEQVRARISLRLLGERSIYHRG